MDKLLIKRGSKRALEQLDPLPVGELFLAKDEERLYVGGPRGNISLPTQKDLDEKHQEVITQLDQIEKEVDKKHQQVTTQLDQIEKEVDEKATKTELQQVSLAYKESYDTLDDLKNAYPNGDVYNHVVLADGMIYTYAKGEWISTGVVANGAIEFMKAYEDLKVLGVGGRNLLTGTSKEFETINIGNFATRIPNSTFDMGGVLNVGDTVTLRAYIKAPQGRKSAVRITEYYSDGSDPWSLGGPYVDDGYSTLTYTIGERNPNVSHIYLYFQNDKPGENSTYDIEYKEVKLEKGNKATDWTPAPEDIDAHPFVVELAETVFRSKQNEERIRNLENAITALGGDS